MNVVCVLVTRYLQHAATIRHPERERRRRRARDDRANRPRRRGRNGRRVGRDGDDDETRGRIREGSADEMKCMY